MFVSRKKLIVLVVIMVLVVAAACVVVPMWVYGQAQRDVMAKARGLAHPARPVRITSAEMSLSFSHGLWVLCRLGPCDLGLHWLLGHWAFLSPLPLTPVHLSGISHHPDLEEHTGMSLLIVGSVAFDTIKTSGGIAEEVLGGSALYCAYAASFFHTAGLMSPVGEDMPSEHLHDMQQDGIDTAGIKIVPGGKTFRWTGSYNDDFSVRPTEDIQLNVFGDYDTTVPQTYDDAEYVFLANGAPEAQKAVLKQLPDRKMAFLDTMNHWIEGSRAALEDVLTMVDGLLVNDEEARLLTGEQNLVAAARVMNEMGPRIVVIKKGEHGCILRMDDKVFALPAWLTETVKDPTGAGDCFGGGLIGYLASVDGATIESVRAGIVCGTIVASFCIEEFSIERLRAIALNDIQRRRREFLGTVSWC